MILLFVPAILTVFDLGGLLDPVKVMVTKILTFCKPVRCGSVGLAGWLLADPGGLVTNILAPPAPTRARIVWDSIRRCAQVMAPSC